MNKKFKTTIQCAACVAKVTPALNEVVGKDRWHVDISDPAKTLSVSDEADTGKIVDALGRIGYKAEPIS